MKPITDLQKKFCAEFIKDDNGTAAVVRAGYSENGASQQAHSLLQNERIHQQESEAHNLRSFIFFHDSPCFVYIQNRFKFGCRLLPYNPIGLSSQGLREAIKKTPLRRSTRGYQGSGTKS